MSGDEAEWHCKQLPNGANPIVVCERAVLLAETDRLRAEVERLRAAGDRLAAAINAVACSGPRDEMAELTAAYIDWEARRG